MLASYFVFTLSWVISLSLVAAGLAPLNSDLQIRNAAGTSSLETMWAFRRALSSAATPKRDTVYKNSTSLDKSWVGAVLFSREAEAHKGNIPVSAGVEIVCTTCYIKGTATAQFTIDGNFNVSQAFHDVISQTETEVGNVTTAAINYVETSVERYVDTFLNDVITKDDFDINDVDFPSFQIDFDVDIPDIPECELQFQFDGMELYVEIDTIISGGATYTVSLYKSETPIGVTVSNDMFIGVVFSIDLILSVDSEIDISSGFHIQLDDGVAIDLPMFNHGVSSITFNGGSFEFLPVIIQSAGILLDTLLRVGMQAGFEVSTPSETVEGYPLEFSAGLFAGIWADVAQLTTNVTAAPAGSVCELHVVEEYSMLLGANAGATLAIGKQTWGPTANTQVPIWYTTLLDVCAVTGSATAAGSAAATAVTILARDDLTTTTISTKVTYTVTACQSIGLVNCPASLQSTAKNTITKTLVTAVPSGSVATFPATTQSNVFSTVAFGTNIKRISPTSGSPISYIPTPSPGILKGETGGVSNKVIIGVSVGIGLPVLIATIAGCIYCCMRKRYAKVEVADPTYVGHQAFQTSKPYYPGSYMSDGKMSPNVTVVEDQWHY